MIRTEERFERLANLLLRADEVDENSIVDFKLKPYSKDFECDMYKDVIALLNSYDRFDEDRWIVFGVNDKTHDLVGFDAANNDLLDDATYQQKFYSRIRPRPSVELVTICADRVMGEVDGAGKMFAALYIPKENFGVVFEMAKDVVNSRPKPGKNCPEALYPGDSFFRNGSSTERLMEGDRQRIRALSETRAHQPVGLLASASDRAGVYADAAQAFTATDEIDNLRLLGSWNEQNACDRQAISKMCSAPYPEVIRKMRGDLDSGVFTVRTMVWNICDRLAMLQTVGSHMTGLSLVALAEHFSGILVSVDHMYEMPPEGRIMADVAKVDRGCSLAARRGAASFCACLANNPSYAPHCTNGQIEEFLANAMRGLFASDDWRALASSDLVMPLLAQASPSLFLRFVNWNLDGVASIRGLLEQRAGGMGSHSLGSGLVQGIQIAAIRDDCFSEAIATLVRISSFASGAKGAIVAALLPWHPQTNAPVDPRKGMGDYLARQEEPAAWNALLDLLPGNTTSVISLPELEFMQIADLTRDVDLAEYWDVSRAYCAAALKGTQGDVSRIFDLASNVGCLIRASMLPEFGALIKNARSSLEDAECYLIWSELLSYKQRCEEFSDADWSPPEEVLAEVGVIISAIEPADGYFPALRALSLNDHELVMKRGMKERRDEAVSIRLSAFSPLYEENGLTVVDQLLEDGAKGRILGETIALLDLREDESNEILAMLDVDSAIDAEHLAIARSFIWSKSRVEGQAWIDSIAMSHWPRSRIARFFATLPLMRKNWMRAAGLLADDALLYWMESPGGWRFENAEDAEYCIGQYVSAGRVDVALDLISCCIEDDICISPLLIENALFSVRASDIDMESVYQIQRLLKHLELTNPGDKLCALEFQFIPHLQDWQDAYLFSRMSQDPGLFVEVISMAYGEPQVGDSQPVLSPDIRWTIRNRVLDNWKVPIGLTEEGCLDKAVFETWLESARSKAAESAVIDGADRQIGRNLFYAPADEDGFFLHDAAASFLDSNRAALNGFSLEAFNSRGVHAVDSTGKAEEDIASSYDMKAIAVEGRGYVNLALALRSIARSYRREAEYNRSNG